ncbi:helix-turn-helix domain-containing protein [Candidatus Woesearchaeota archaeon]|nr:helix-turn-helix domain-containing protein [Candidatus Woesearchaeota archaeon]
MSKTYLIKEKDNKLYYSNAIIVDNPSALKIIDHPIREKILRLLAKTPMYPAELAKELKMHEQKVYYHIKQMVNSGILEIAEKKEIRGTIAKKFSPRCLNFAVSLSNDWKQLHELTEKKDSKTVGFLEPFTKENEINASIVVGSPDPHGPHKARARDGHYAIDLALFLGNFCNVSKEFITKLDVDTDLNEDINLFVVGGPVTNLICGKINDFLPAKFSDKKPWGIISKKKTYTDDSVGLIARIPNPYNLKNKIMIIAGIRFIGTKAAVMAFTRNMNLVLARFSEQEKFYCIVQGFDLSGDGKIDSIEVLE